MFILSQSGIFIGKRYLRDDLFKMNVMTIITNIENNNKIVFYFIFLSLVMYGMVG
jgi:hypothetical protein